MAFVVFVVLLAALVGGLVGPSWLGRTRQPGPGNQGGEPRPGPSVATLDEASVPSDGEREEMRLAERVLAGELTPAQYQGLMTELAELDAKAHPRVPPPDLGEGRHRGQG